MSAGTKNILLEQGASFRMAMTWTHTSGQYESDGVTPIPGAPRDLTGCRARMQIRQAPGLPVLVDLTTENGGIILGTAGDMTTGRIEIYISPVQTELIEFKKAVYDLFVIYPGEIDSVRVLKGKVTTEFTVTNDGDGAPI